MSSQPYSFTGHLSRKQPSLALWRAQPYHSGQEVPSAVNRPAPRPVEHAFSSVLLLVRHDDHAVVDRQSLRRVGFRAIRVMTSGADAARVLCGRQRLTDGPPFPDVILCDEQLADMTGLEFLTLVRSHPKLADFPIIMALNRDTPAVRRQLEEQAASGVLYRPYSGDAFLNQLVRAAAMHPPRAGAESWLASEEETNSFDLALSRCTLARRVSEQTAGQWYREGLLCLKQEQWEAAAVAFQQALKDHAGHGDAVRGLTLALRKRQEQAEAGRKRLSKEQADALREDLLRASRSPNPEQAISQVIAALDGSPAAPAQAWGALDLSEEPAERNASSPSGQTSAGAAKKGGSAQKVQLSGTRSQPDQAGSSGIALLPELPEPDGTGFIRHFPLLRDAVNVVRMTRNLYKIRKK